MARLDETAAVQRKRIDRFFADHQPQVESRALPHLENEVTEHDRFEAISHGVAIAARDQVDRSVGA